MTVHVYRSTDAGAPTLGTAAGSVIALLDACLVNGYGTQAPAGWTKPFSSGTTQAVYRQPANNQRYLYVNDTNASFAILTGYETMTSLSVGTNSFAGGGAYVARYNAAFSWLLVATGAIFHLWIGSGTSTNYTGYGYCATGCTFGDITPYNSNDNYCTILVGGGSGEQSTHSSKAWNLSSTITDYWGSRAIVRSISQLGSAVFISAVADPFGKSYPIDPVQTSIRITPIEISELVYNCYRGVVPGMWAVFVPLNPSFFDNGMIYTFTRGPLAGKTMDFRFVIAASGANTNYCIGYEVSNTW